MPVGCPGRRHRVGDEGDPSGRARERECDDVGVHMGAVGDDLERHAVVAHRGDDGARGAVVDAGHAVERVREDRRPGVERRPGLLLRGRRVADGDRDARRDELGCRIEAAREFGRERHLADGAAAGVDEAGDGGRVRGAQQALGVGALVRHVEERALEV